MSGSQGVPTTGRNIIIVLVVIMAIVHQDVWLWSNQGLVFGFIPAGLAYHAGYSIAAATLWFIAMKIAWPTHLEEFAEETQGDQNH